MQGRSESSNAWQNAPRLPTRATRWHNWARRARGLLSRRALRAAVHVDEGRIVHDIRGILAAKHIAGDDHVSSHLIDLVKGAFGTAVRLLGWAGHHVGEHQRIAENAQNVLVADFLGLSELGWCLNVNNANPEAFAH